MRDVVLRIICYGVSPASTSASDAKTGTHVNS